ncbi:hypothetical protein GF362_04000 [Candidatus Dojkabacteria bacterium]|nr:hypothetical protein [Candidatus Dojkabacteria bacterium]
MKEISNENLITRAKEALSDPNIISSTEFDFPVTDVEGGKLGSLREFLIDLVSGEISYGILAIGEQTDFTKTVNYAIPWELFDYNSEKGEYLLRYDQEYGDYADYPVYQGTHPVPQTGIKAV